MKYQRGWKKQKRINIEAIRIQQEMLPWCVLYRKQTHLGSHVIVYFSLPFLYFRFKLFHGFFGTFTLFTAFIDQLFDFIVFISAKGTIERVSVKRYGSNNHLLISLTWMETLITSFIYAHTIHTFLEVYCLIIHRYIFSFKDWYNINFLHSELCALLS